MTHTNDFVSVHVELKKINAFLLLNLIKVFFIGHLRPWSFYSV